MSGNPAICNKVQGAKLKNRYYVFFKDECYRSCALDKEDMTICDKIQDYFEKSLCYHDIALIKEDSSICDKIENQMIKGRCTRGIAKNKDNL